MKIMDFQNEGLGDVVLGCWIVQSAEKQGKEVFMNPRSFHQIPKLLNINPKFITSNNGGNWTSNQDGGFIRELEKAHVLKKSRFEFWAESLGVFGLKADRPRLSLDENVENWAREEWQNFSDNKKELKIVLLPETTRNTRTWPMIHWLRLSESLSKSHNTCVMGLHRNNIEVFNLYKFWGQPLENFIAILNQADLVISADSGGAHLAATIKTHVIGLLGPTIGNVVFDHDEYAHPLAVEKEVMSCVGCNFSADMNYNEICKQGCGALFLLSPQNVVDKVEILKKEVLYQSTREVFV